METRLRRESLAASAPPVPLSLGSAIDFGVVRVARALRRARFRVRDSARVGARARVESGVDMATRARVRRARERQTSRGRRSPRARLKLVLFSVYSAEFRPMSSKTRRAWCPACACKMCNTQCNKLFLFSVYSVEFRPMSSKTRRAWCPACACVYYTCARCAAKCVIHSVINCFCFLCIQWNLDR